MTDFTHMDWQTLTRWVEGRGFPNLASEMQRDNSPGRAEAVAAIIYRWEPRLAEGLRAYARRSSP
jgi:hypothetical protein